jgi:hypothetical protein
MVLIRKTYPNVNTAIRRSKNTVLLAVLTAFVFITTFIYSYSSTTLNGEMNWGTGGNMTVSQSLGYTENHWPIIGILCTFLVLILCLFYRQGLYKHENTWVFPASAIIACIMISTLVWVTVEKNHVAHVAIAFFLFIGVQCLVAFTVWTYWNADRKGNSELRLRFIVFMLLVSVIVFVSLIISFVRSYNDEYIYALNFFALMEVTMLFILAFWVILIGWYPALKYKSNNKKKKRKK